MWLSQRPCPFPVWCTQTSNRGGEDVELLYLYAILVVLLILVGLLSTLMQLAVFGTKANQLIAETKSNIQALQVLVKEMSLLRKQGR